MKSALAPTIDLATPRVEKFVKEKLLPGVSNHATLDRFYLCEPGDSSVSSLDGKEHWVEGNWGAHIICDQFSTDYLRELSKLSDVISVNDASVRAAPGLKIEVNFWLSARVMR